MPRSLLLRLLTCRLAVFALLLKAAVPLLAATAAQLHGLPVAQLCTLYGVVTMPVSGAADREHALGHHHHHHDAGGAEGHDSGSRPAADHAHDHCALTAVAVMALGSCPPACPPPDDETASLPASGAQGPGADGCARWAARLAHGPPGRA